MGLLFIRLGVHDIVRRKKSFSGAKLFFCAIITIIGQGIDNVFGVFEFQRGRRA